MQRAALRAAWGGRGARAPPARCFGSAPRPPPVLPADAEALRELRRRTGLPWVRCREALNRCGGDREEAERWLLRGAQQWGWDRLSLEEGGSRPPPTQGLVGVVRRGLAGAMVELSCDTDFVARTPQFQRLVELAALATMSHCQAAPPHLSEHLLGQEELEQLRVPGGGLLSEELALGRGLLAERVSLRHAGWLRVPRGGGAGFVGAYAHGWVPPREPVAMGTHGALVTGEVTAPPPPPPPALLEELGRQVAQHVVAFAPRELGTPEDPPGQEEGEGRLLAQPFLLRPGVSVGQELGARGGEGLRLRGFLRFRCGEEPLPHGLGGGGAAAAAGPTDRATDP